MIKLLWPKIMCFTDMTNAVLINQLMCSNFSLSGFDQDFTAFSAFLYKALVHVFTVQ